MSKHYYYYYKCFTNFSVSTSRTSSRASSRAASVSSDISEETPEVYTEMSSETRNLSGRKDTTVNYKTHQTRTHSIPVAHTASQRASGGRIPKPSPAKKHQKCPQHGI